MEATRKSVLRAMQEYQRIGPDEFFKKYSGGRAAYTRFIEHGGVHYPLKAVWAAAHRPPEPGSNFNSNQAQSRIAKLGFMNAITRDDPRYALVLDEVHRLRQPDRIQVEKLVRQEAVLEGERVLRELEVIKRHAGIVARVKAARAPLVCEACGFDFEDVYGNLGSDFIEAHHRNPLASRKGKDRITDVEDLALLCCNCHAMVHRHGKCISVKELVDIMDRQRSSKTKVRGMPRKQPRQSSHR